MARVGGSMYRPTMSVSSAANAGSRDRLNVRTRCGWSLCAVQMRCTEVSEMPTARAIARPVQCVAWCGGIGAGQCRDARHGLGRDQWLAGLARLVPQQPIRARLGEALLPSPHHRMADAEARRHRLHWAALRRHEHDLYPLDMLLRSATIASSRCLSDKLRIMHTVCAMQVESHGRRPL